MKESKETRISPSSFLDQAPPQGAPNHLNQHHPSPSSSPPRVHVGTLTCPPSSSYPGTQDSVPESPEPSLTSWISARAGGAVHPHLDMTVALLPGSAGCGLVSPTQPPSIPGSLSPAAWTQPQTCYNSSAACWIRPLLAPNRQARLGPACFCLMTVLPGGQISLLLHP